MLKKIKIIVVILIVYFVILIISRYPLIVDDVVPEQCPEMISKSDIIYVIPIDDGLSLVDFPEWCQEMQVSGKVFGLHGIKHDYHEFGLEVNEEELNDAVNIFEECFDYTPELFRPPQNKISAENKELVESLGMKVYQRNYLLHPYCHCNPGWLMKIFNWLIWC